MSIKNNLIELRNNLIELRNNLIELRNKLINGKVDGKYCQRLFEFLNNDKEQKEIVVLSDEEVTKILEDTTLIFFPESGIWWPHCFEKPSDYVKCYLPCHLRDDEWLAHTFQVSHNLNNIEYKRILEFVKTSKLFKEERYKYELRIVEWQISWMLSGGEGWLVPEQYDEDLIDFHEDYDIGFREGILKTLLAIGMDKNVIEEGIERYGYLWRDNCMRRAFNNKYDFDLDHFNYGIKIADSDHRNNWVKMRKYEYYCRHKESVDKYSSNLDEFKMTDVEVVRVYAYLEKKNAERIAYIEECKNNYAKKREFRIS